MAIKLYFNVMYCTISQFVFNCPNEPEFEFLCDNEYWIM